MRGGGALLRGTKARTAKNRPSCPNVITWDKAGPGVSPDIDGLRAIAVLAVLAFHAFPEYAPGGFVGVDDLSFVISGFLISGLILKRLRQGNFSFAQFTGGASSASFRP